jgi:hypothetical protein
MQRKILFIRVGDRVADELAMFKAPPIHAEIQIVGPVQE